MIESTPPPSTFRLRRRTPGSFLLVPCPRLGRSLRCQGQLEAAAAVVLAACPQVVDVQEQPMSIWYAWAEVSSGTQVRLLDKKPDKRRGRTDGERTSYTVPDFLVRMADGTTRLVEVKPSHRLGREIVRRKMFSARMFATANVWTYHVLTECELRAGPLVRNLRLLARYRVLDVNADLLRLVIQNVPQVGISIGQLVQQVNAKPTALRAHLFHALADGRLSLDPTQKPLTNETFVFPAGEIKWDPFESLWAPNICSTDEPIVWSASSPATAILSKMRSSA